MISRKIILIGFLFFQFSSLISQVKGIVVDEDNTPLEYATVAIYKQTDKALIAGIVTDSLGAFSFTNLAKGNYFLKVSFIGYNEKTINNITINNSNIICSKNSSLRLICERHYCNLYRQNKAGHCRKWANTHAYAYFHRR